MLSDALIKIVFLTTEINFLLFRTSQPPSLSLSGFTSNCGDYIIVEKFLKLLTSSTWSWATSKTTSCE